MIFFFISFLLCIFIPKIFQRFWGKTSIGINKERPMFLGVSIYISLLIVFSIAYLYSNSTNLFLERIMISSFFILALGLGDDISHFSVFRKFVGQSIIAGIAIFLGIRTSIAFIPDWANMVITLFWIVALVNAFNFLDIMDGLCTGVSLIICVTFLLMSIISGDYHAGVFFSILSGSLLAAWIHNRPPARFYLGDSGSMLIGYIFACSAMQISYAIDFQHGLALFVPILIVWVPLYDLFLTVFIRFRKKISVFQKSNDHFVFILRNKGFRLRTILIIMYVFCLLSSLCALLLRTASLSWKPWMIGFFLLFMIYAHKYFYKILKNSTE